MSEFAADPANATLPLIRSFTENSASAAKPQADASGKWTVCAPETVGTFSATLFVFGREPHRDLKVPSA